MRDRILAALLVVGTIAIVCIASIGLVALESAYPGLVVYMALGIVIALLVFSLYKLALNIIRGEQ